MNTVCKICFKQQQFHFLAVCVESTNSYLQYITKVIAIFVTKLRKRMLVSIFSH